VLLQLGEFKSMDSLTLDGMGLTDLAVLRGLPCGLLTLNLPRNAIKEVSGVAWPSTLTELSLRNNFIEKIDALRLPASVKHLDLRHNNIETIDGFEGPSRLEELLLNHNGLTCFDFKGLEHTRLSYVNVSDNEIERLSFCMAPVGVKTFNASNNPVRDILIRRTDVNSFKEGLHLFMSPCNLTGFSRRIFELFSRIGDGTNRKTLRATLRHWRIACILIRANGNSLAGKLPRDLRRLLITDYMKLSGL
jgi:Leucine-rich repeat (LRR) protein